MRPKLPRDESGNIIRQEISGQRRRRNSDQLRGVARRLAVDESKLDRENYAYRFATNDEDRLHRLTVQDDWEIVADRGGEIKDDAASEGSEVSVRAGAGATGAPQKLVLLRKPKVYADEDEAAKQRRIDEKEAGLKRGVVPGADMTGTYTPQGGGMKISRQR